jgi:hypothetical protein
MKKLLLASVFAFGLAGATTANAADFTLSDFHGTGQYGTATGTLLADGTTFDVMINMDPNVLIQNGSHFLLTLSLAGTGRIDPTSVTFGSDPPDSLTVLAHGGSYDNGPFKNFTDGLSAVGCSPSMSIGCGETLDFHITNFAGFLPGTNTISGSSAQVFAAVDVLLLGGCTGNCTGPVGLSAAPTPVPGPLAGAGLPGIIAGCIGMVGLARRRIFRRA